MVLGYQLVYQVVVVVEVENMLTQVLVFTDVVSHFC